jgi:hypothetical protein
MRKAKHELIVRRPPPFVRVRVGERKKDSGQTRSERNVESGSCVRRNPKADSAIVAFIVQVIVVWKHYDIVFREKLDALLICNSARWLGGEIRPEFTPLAVSTHRGRRFLGAEPFDALREESARTLP